MEEKYPCPKMTPGQWIANFWYYNKWYVLIAVVVLTLITISTVQYFTKTDADVSLFYVGSSKLGDRQCQAMIDTAKERIFDANEDGEIGVDLQTVVLLSDFDLLSKGEEIQAMEKYQTYSNEILSGDGAILLLDEYFYSELAESGALVNLYEISSELPDSAIDYFGIKLSKTKLYKEDGFSSLPGDTIICLKFSSVVSELSEKEKAQRDAVNREIFRSLLIEEF